MGLPQNLGRLSAALTSDASLNIGVGVNPSGSFKFEVGTTSKFTGVATFGSTLSNGTYSYTLPGATGTFALVGGAGVGTVTSVAALTLGTSGTDLSSTVANGTTTPVITLNVPDASATARGVVTTGAQTFAGAKTFNNGISASNSTGNTIASTCSATGGLAFYGQSSGGIGAQFESSASGEAALIAKHTSTGPLQYWMTTSGVVATMSNAGGLTLAGQLTLSSTITNGTYTYTLPSATGTLALTSALSGYLPLTGGTLTGALSGTSASFSQGISADVGSATSSIQVRNASTDAPFIGFFRGGTLRNTLQLLTDGSFKLTDASLVANAGLTMGALSGTSATFSTASNDQLIINSTNSTGAKEQDIKFTNQSVNKALIRNVAGGNIFDFYSYEYGFYPLRIASTGAATFSSSVTATSFSNAGLQSGEVFNGTKSNAGYFVGYLQNTSATGLGLYIQNGNDANDALRIGNAAGSANNIQLFGSGKAYFAGNVGIGTTSPTAKLQITSTSAGAASVALFLNNNSATSSTETRIAFAANTNDDISTNRYSYISALNTSGSNGQALIFATNETGNAAVERLRIASTGAATFSSSVTASAFIPSGSSVPTNGMYLSAANTLNFATNTTNRLSISSTGETSFKGVVGGSLSALPQFYINSTGANYGLLQNLNSTTWSIGYGTSVSALGTSLISWNTSGRVGINTSTPTAKLEVQSGTGNLTTGLFYNYTGDQTATNLISTSGRADVFYHFQAFSSNTTEVFRIESNGNAKNTNGSYGSLSDIKIKENISDATHKLEDLLKVRIRNYNIIGQETKQIGVIAQELEEIFPSMVDENQDRDDEGNLLETTTKGVKYSVFVPMLIKAIQELSEKITQLENK